MIRSFFGNDATASGVFDTRFTPIHIVLHFILMPRNIANQNKELFNVMKTNCIGMTSADAMKNSCMCM